MAVLHYRELIVWQRSMDLVVEVYRRTDGFPKSEAFGLTNQMRRAAVSVPSNIAEGQGRSTAKDFAHFLHIARGSLHELETQACIAHRLGYLPDDAAADIAGRTAEVARILNGLIRSLSGGQ